MGCREICGGGQFPDYAKARPYVFVLHPGEIVLVPKGWWHYGALAIRAEERAWARPR